MLAILLAFLEANAAIMSPKEVQQFVLKFVWLLRMDPMSCAVDHFDVHGREKLRIDVALARVHIIGVGSAQKQAWFMVMRGRVSCFREIKDVVEVRSDNVQINDGNQMSQNLVRLEVGQQKSTDRLFRNIVGQKFIRMLQVIRSGIAELFQGTNIAFKKR